MRWERGQTGSSLSRSPTAFIGRNVRFPLNETYRPRRRRACPSRRYARGIASGDFIALLSGRELRLISV